MKYYKDSKNKIYAYESDGSQDKFIKKGLSPITDTERETILNPFSSKVAAKLQEALSGYKTAKTAVITYNGNKFDVAVNPATGLDPIKNLLETISGFQGKVPTGFYWVAHDNSHVPFTYSDLTSLADAITQRGWTAFTKLQTYKAQILLATKQSMLDVISLIY